MDKKEILEKNLINISSEFIKYVYRVCGNYSLEDIAIVPILGELMISTTDDYDYDSPEGTFIVNAYYMFNDTNEKGVKNIMISVRPDNSINIRKDIKEIIIDTEKHENATKNKNIYQLTDITEIKLENNNPVIRNRKEDGYYSYIEYVEKLNDIYKIKKMNDIKSSESYIKLNDKGYLKSLIDLYRTNANEFNECLKDEMLIRLCIGR